MKKEEFQKLSIYERYGLIKAKADFIGTRDIITHRVHLFTLDGLTVEMYVYIPLNHIQWIEVQTNPSILDEYLENLDWKNELGWD